MAHQAHNIPWTLLSSCLSWRLTNNCKGDATDLHLSPKRDRGKKLTYFTTAFARNIHKHVECELRKHAQCSSPPSTQDEVVITDDAAALIAPIIRRWRQSSNDGRGKIAEAHRVLGACSHQSGGCDCVIPLASRKMAAFSEPFRAAGCYSHMHLYSSGFFSMEVFTAMLLHGQMEALFRLCSFPEVAMQTWWRQQECYCLVDFFGWHRVSRLAIDAYVMLNVLQHFPQTWERGHRDYRRLKSYQEVVYRATKQSEDELPTYPHRHFFGISDKQFKSPSDWDSPRSWERWLGQSASRRHQGCEPKREGSILGHIPYEAFVALDRDPEYEYLPLFHDVGHVRWILCRLGLPTELANIILTEASYYGHRRLPVPDDPLHPSNKDELRKYLTYTWQLIVRSAALSTFMGMNIDWENEISGSILRLFGCSCKNHQAPSLYNINYETSEEGVIKFL